MLKRFTVLAAIGVICSFAIAQTTQKPYAYTFTKGAGDCTFTGVTLDQVWAASVKALMFQTWKGKPVDRNHLGALSLDKPSGVIMGGWAVGSSFFSGVVGQRLEILIETRPGGIGMYCTMPGMMNRKGEEYYEKQFFDKVVELLYGTSSK